MSSSSKNTTPIFYHVGTSLACLRLALRCPYIEFSERMIGTRAHFQGPDVKHWDAPCS
jgi:hypothetical protein